MEIADQQNQMRQAQRSAANRQQRQDSDSSEEDGGRAEASTEDDGEGAHGGVVARLLPADADSALQVVPVSGLDGGGIGRRHHIGGREETAVAVGDVTLAGDAREQEEVKREGGREISTRINEAEEPAACARRAMRGRAAAAGGCVGGGLQWRWTSWLLPRRTACRRRP